MIERTIKKQIIKSIKSKPVTLITGARQVGKSTLCYEIKKEFHYDYVSLDNLRERELAIRDPEFFLQMHKWPLIIDEIQYAPKLFEVLETIVNKEKMEKGSNYGMFIITGSSTQERYSIVQKSLLMRILLFQQSDHRTLNWKVLNCSP